MILIQNNAIGIKFKVGQFFDAFVLGSNFTMFNMWSLIKLVISFEVKYLVAQNCRVVDLIIEVPHNKPRLVMADRVLAAIRRRCAENTAPALEKIRSEADDVAGMARRSRAIREREGKWT